MIVRHALVGTLAVVWTAWGATAAAALDTAAIQAVQKQCAGRAPTAAENQTIAAFVDQAVTAIMAAVDPAEAIAAREQLIKFRSWEKSLAPYSRSYVLAAQKRLAQAFQRVTAWSDAEAKLRTERNLIIATARLGSVELRDLAIARLKHTDATVRYWAIKALTSQRVVDELNNALTSDTATAQAILKALEAHLASEPEPAILERIASFAARLKAPQDTCTKLLLAIADMRTKAYERWTVRSERSDAVILQSLATAIQATQVTQDKTRLAQAFAQLYSYVIQRRILGDATLGDLRKYQLKYTIVAVGQDAIGRLLGRPYPEISQAAAQDDVNKLRAAHDALLGGAGRAGLLPTQLKFQYAGSSAAPKALKPPAPPAQDNGG